MTKAPAGEKGQALEPDTKPEVSISIVPVQNCRFGSSAYEVADSFEPDNMVTIPPTTKLVIAEKISTASAFWTRVWNEPVMQAHSPSRRGEGQEWRSR